MFRFISRLTLLIAATILPLATAAAPSAKPIVVAQPVDLSGVGADFGRDFSLGAKVYFDHINARGGIKGRKIAYRMGDTGGQPSRALRIARTMVDEGAEVIFGASGDSVVDALAGDSRLRGAGIPLFGAVGGNTRLQASDGVFFLRASLGDEIRTMVSQLKGLGIATFGLASADENTREATAAINTLVATAGIRLVSQVQLPSNDKGAASAANKIALARPQAVIVVADTLSAAQFFKRYRSLDPGAFLGAPSMVNVRTLISAIGPQAARGLIISQVVPNPAAILDVTREHLRLMEKYADEPSSPATLEGFIAAKMLIAALQKSPDTSPSALRQTLLGEGHVDLGGYQLDFGTGNRPSRFVELSVINREGRLLR